MYEVDRAVSGYHESLKDQKDIAAQQAAWITNGARYAHHAENFKAVKAKQFFDRDWEPPTEEEQEEERDDLTQIFPRTL